MLLRTFKHSNRASTAWKHFLSIFFNNSLWTKFPPELQLFDLRITRNWNTTRLAPGHWGMEPPISWPGSAQTAPSLMRNPVWMFLHQFRKLCNKLMPLKTLTMRDSPQTASELIVPIHGYLSRLAGITLDALSQDTVAWINIFEPWESLTVPCTISVGRKKRHSIFVPMSSLNHGKSNIIWHIWLSATFHPKLPQ